MKLNKYIYAKLKEGNEDYMGYEATEEDIEEWIVDWYRSSFNEVGCDGDIPTPRMPPMWLANWKNFVHERSVEEQERCGIDEG